MVSELSGPKSIIELSKCGWVGGRGDAPYCAPPLLVFGKLARVYLLSVPQCDAGMFFFTITSVFLHALTLFFLLFFPIPFGSKEFRGF